MSSHSDRSASGDHGGPPHPGSSSDVRNAGTYFLGRYRVVDEIGIGGMASVHLARMDGPGGFQKWVAIKKIHSHLVEDESFVQMFLDEARVAARISHPNVATVFDLGKHEDTYWIAMEYLHGEPLREVMRRTEELGTAMPPEIACRVIADAAEGLHAAHELLGKNGEMLGLVHRDVTPHNLFVTYDGVTKVVDFGIAKFSSRMSHTRAGTLKGKLAYMSPEQVHGEGIDRRTDVFALGVVLWELTTGQRLFRMESDLDTLAKVQECNVPRPSTLIRGYPVDLEKIVMKALAKNRGERFRTAREFSRALQSLLMRRGLFIASDEVAGYTQHIFTDRIQKREEHLRWAADVTQTINVEQLLAKPKIESPDFTGSEAPGAPSNAQGKPHAALAMGGPPRPAAGLPAAETFEASASLSSGRGSGSAFAAKGPSRAPPRPAAGAPAPLLSTQNELHPADVDGPTIQGTSMVDAAENEHLQALQLPPTLSVAPEDRPRPRGGSAHPVERIEVERIDPEEEFEEDQDETIVGNTAGAPSLGSGGAVPSGRNPNAPQPPGPAPTPPRPQRFSEHHEQPQHGHLQSYGTPSPSYPVEAPYDAMAMGANRMGVPPGVHEAQDYGRPAPYVEAYPWHGNPAGPPGDPNQRPRMVPREGYRTIAAQRFKRRPPMWVVAALSCSIALLFAGVVIAIISTTSRSSSPRAATSSARGAAPPGRGAASGSGVGPFTAARTAFNTVATPVVTPPPTASAAPPPGATPPPLGSAAPPATPIPVPSGASAAVASSAYGEVVAPSHPTANAQAPAPASPPASPNAAAVPSPRKAAAPTAPALPTLGGLTVVCMPKCDQIIDNGSSLGPGHIFNRPVPTGRHVLVLSAPNASKKTMTVDVKPEQTTEVRMTMDK